MDWLHSSEVAAEAATYPVKQDSAAVVSSFQTPTIDHRLPPIAITISKRIDIRSIRMLLLLFKRISSCFTIACWGSIVITKGIRIIVAGGVIFRTSIAHTCGSTCVGGGCG